MNDMVNWFASSSTIAAAILVAANISPRASGIGFIIFTISSLCWIAIGVIDEEPALTTQNAVLTLINLVGVYRYLLRPALNADSQHEAKT